MKRGLVAALAIAAVASLVWLLWSGPSPAGKSAARKGRRAPATSSAGGGPIEEGPLGGVARRDDVDRSGVGRVRGRIVDEDGTPVPEGRVILHCLATKAETSFPIAGGAVEVGPEGEFSGPGCRGVVCAEFRHPTLLPRDAWVLEPGTAPVTVVARPLERIVGSVTDPEGQPIAGAQLMVRRGPGDDDPSALPPFTSRSTVSDGEGIFIFARVERPPCDPCGEASGRCEPGSAAEVPTYATLTLVARAPGFRSTERSVEVGEDEPWQIVLQPPLAPLTGTLTDAEGRVYPRARVLARARARGYEVHHARVEQGRFALSELGEGIYDLRAVQDGVELAVAREHQAGEEVAMVGSVPALGRSVVLEVLRSGADDPVAGALVEGGPFAGARTDADGQVRAEGVLPGMYALGIRVPGQGSQRREFSVPEGGEDPYVGHVEVIYNPQ